MTPPALDDLVSAHVHRGVTLRYGPAGRRWLDRLPGLVEQLLTRHRLTLTGPLGGGALSAVLAVTTENGSPAVLKIHPDATTWAAEKGTLAAWASHASTAGLPPVTPTLLATDPSALATVMTRLVPGTQLRLAPLAEPGAVAAEAATLTGLFAVLRDTPAPTDRSLEPLTARLVTSARAVLAASETHPRLEERLAGVAGLHDAAAGRLPLSPDAHAWSHGDLIPNNVLADGDRWALLDPLPVAGEAASDVAFLAVARLAGSRTRDLIEAYATAADVDADRAALFARLWAADRLRVAGTHDFFGPAQWDALATVARHGPVT